MAAAKLAHDKFTPQKATVATIKAAAAASASVPDLRTQVAALCDQVSALLDLLATTTTEPNPANNPRALIVDDS